MKLVRRFYGEFVIRYWKRLLIALVLTATIGQAGFAFSMLGMWLVDDVLMVGQAIPAAVDVDTPAEGLLTPQTGVAPDADAGEAAAPAAAGREGIDAQQRQRMLGGLLLFLAISIGMHFTVALLGGISGYLTQFTGQQVLYRLRLALKRKLVGLSAAFYSRHQTGHLMVRVLDDANAVQANTVNLPVNFLTYLITLGMGLFLLWRLNPTMTLIALGILPMYAMGSILFMNALRKNTEQIRIANAELQGLVEEKLTLIGTVKAYAQEPAEARRFFKQLRHNLDLAWRQNKLNTGLSVTLLLVSGLGATGILLYGFLQIRAGAMQIGAVLAFYQMTGLLFGPVTSLTNMSIVLNTTQVLLERVYEVLDTTPEVVEAAEPVRLERIEGRIDFENVSLRYGQDGPVAVTDLSFHVEPGQRVALLGTSGSGRTTIAHLLLRFHDPDQGVVKIDGVDIRSLSLNQSRLAIGLAAQEARLFAGTIRDNIAFGAADVTDQRIEQAARVAGIHDQITALPNGYQTAVGKGGANLDAVLVQRIAVARLLVADPAILIFDDSASTLSDDDELLMYQAVGQAFAGRTQLIITNRVQTAMAMDHIVVMRSGRLVEQGTHEQLLSAHGLYWQMYLHQTQRPNELPTERWEPEPEAFLVADEPPEQSL